MSNRILEFFDGYFYVLFFGTLAVSVAILITFCSIHSHVSYYLDKGYKTVYQNTNPISNVTHVTLREGDKTVYCVGYLLPDNKTLIDSKCKSDELQ